MIVLNFDNDNGGYLACIYPAIRVTWDRVVVRLEYQPKLVVDVNRELLIAIAGKLVSPERSLGWNLSQRGEIL